MHRTKFVDPLPWSQRPFGERDDWKLFRKRKVLFYGRREGGKTKLPCTVRPVDKDGRCLMSFPVRLFQRGGEVTPRQQKASITFTPSKARHER